MSDFSEILYEEAERFVDKGHVTKTANFKNPTWRTAAILKIVKSPYLSEQELSYRKQIARQLRTQYVEGIYDNPLTLKSRLSVTQNHWKRNH